MYRMAKPDLYLPRGGCTSQVLLHARLWKAAPGPLGVPCHTQFIRWVFALKSEKFWIPNPSWPPGFWISSCGSVLCPFCLAESGLREVGHSWEWAYGSTKQGGISLTCLLKNPPSSLSPSLLWAPSGELSLSTLPELLPFLVMTFPCWVQEPSPVPTSPGHFVGRQEYSSWRLIGGCSYSGPSLGLAVFQLCDIRRFTISWSCQGILLTFC